jgi:5-methyltetrahydrofolate--homocysteine methyltransferase
MPENEAGNAVYKMTPSAMAAVLRQFLQKYRKIRIVGGCCGTTPEHIREISRVIAQ